LKVAKTKATVTAESKAKSKAKPKAKAETEKKTAGDTEVTVCRRRSDRRPTTKKSEAITNVKTVSDQEAPAAASESAAPVLTERRKVPRRRQIDPTTCERDYTDDEIEFMHALDAYKRSSGRMFPTCSEILEVVRGLRYAKLTPEEFAEYQAKHQPETADAVAGDFGDEDGDEAED
jgi:hypothetical protein